MSAPGVLVLAGQREGVADPLCEMAGVARKALLPVAGVPQIDRVAAALDAAGLSRPFPVSGLGVARAGFTATPSGSGPADSVLAALEGAEFPVLVTTADHPLLTPGMVRGFLEGARGAGADLCVGLATRATIEADYPTTRRTYLKFADMQVSGCNLFYLARPSALAAVRFWRRAQQDRKRPLKLAGYFGLGTILLYLLGRLDLDGAFERASRRLGIRVRPVLLPFAEAAIDLDTPADLALVETILKRRAAKESA